jgi:hypothetical protein
MKTICFIFLSILSSISFSLNAQTNFPNSHIPSHVHDFAQDYIDKMIEGDIDYCFKQLDKAYQNEKAKQFLINMSDSLKNKTLKNISLASQKTTTIYKEEPLKIHRFTYEYEYKNLWVHYDFQINEVKNILTVNTFRITPSQVSFREIHEFSLAQKSFTHYLVLFWVIAIPLFMFITIIMIFKDKPKRKWLWAIGTLIGIVAINLNWTSGEVFTNLFNFKLLGISFSKASFANPWILSFSIPIIGIIYWVKRSRSNEAVD